MNRKEEIEHLREIREQIFLILFREEFFDRQEMPAQIESAMDELKEDLSDAEKEKEEEKPAEDPEDGDTDYFVSIPADGLESEEFSRICLSHINTAYLKPEDLAYIENKIVRIEKVLGEIDAAVNAAAKGWKTTRMGKVELAIIRLAVYEMRYEDEIPVSVAINEAVELAKKYGGDESPKFVNGILAKLT